MIEALNSDQPRLEVFVQERLRVFHIEAILFRDEGEIHNQCQRKWLITVENAALLG